MKNFLFYFVLVLTPLLLFGQKQPQESIIKSTPVLPSSKIAILKDVDVIFNTRMAFDNYFVDSEPMSSQFSVNQLRFEIKGKVHEKVYFRFRNRYTKISDPNTIDNISRAVDLAYLSIELAPQTKLTFGKMIGDWGGYELLTNPIEILSYNVINDKSDNFQVGAALTYSLSDHKNTFNFQVLNARTKTFQEQYGNTAPPGITQTKTPLSVVANWKGHLFDGKLETTYSFAHFIDAEKANRNYFGLGNKFKTGKLILFYDFQYSKEDLDQKCVITNAVKTKYSYAAQDVSYIDNWIRAEYKIQPKVDILLSLMTNNSYWNGNPDPNKTNRLLTSYGIIPTIEYTPFLDLNLKFYVGYIAKRYDYSSYAESNLNAKDISTGQLSFGIIAPLLVL